MAKLTEAEFSRSCANIARFAASWAADILILPEDCNKPSNPANVARFTDDLRQRLDYIDQRAGRAALAEER